MGQVHQAFGDKVPHIVLALPYAIHAQQGGAKQLPALLLDQAGPDDDVDVPRFILERDKDHALGGLRPLPHCHDAAAAREPAMAAILNSKFLQWCCRCLRVCEQKLFSKWAKKSL